MDDGAARRFDLGELSYVIEGGALRWLSWRGVEVLRGLSAPVRDRDWATSPETSATWEHQADGDRMRHERRFETGDGALAGRLTIEALSEGRLRAAVAYEARADILVNRAGFTLLHPLRGVVGTDATARHPDGRATRFTFPERISPDQPVRDLAGLDHAVRGVAVRIAMTGEVFEMEDQRNWSDASFKTYCRPLSRPAPFRIAPGDTLEQEVRIEVAGVPDDGAARAPDMREARMPEILMAVEPDWLGAGEMPGNAALMRWSAPWSDEAMGRLASSLAGRPLDLEVVVPGGAAPDAVLRDAATALSAAGLRPRHVVALPEAYLSSHQPEGPWPDGPTPRDAMDAASATFPDARIGAGMLTNFTELNRCPVAGGDYVTHGNSAIVHAADDASVRETLEALPDVMRAARAIAGARGYRLGLASIAMRSNPYGAGLAANPDKARMTMTADDPRQDTPFAAAYAIAVVAIAARAGAEAVALGAPHGPFGVAGRPIGTAIAALSALAGRTIRIEGTPPGPLGIDDGARRIVLDAGDAAPRYEGFEHGGPA